VIEQQQKSLTSSNNKFFVLLTTLFVVFFVWMSMAKVDITTVANGLVIPEKNITKLGTMVTGKIVKVNYKQGAIVNKGDIIITINPGVGYEPYHIRANIDGRIQELTYKNPGSVVKQGDALAILVPLDQKLIVQGQLQVKDRGYIEVGQIAKIKLASSEAFTYLPIDAKLISISPDAVQGQSFSFYEIELELDQQTFANGDMQYKLVPGVQVHIFILTGERTILSYVTTPFHNSVGQALQER
jgi:multidrug efflux pump subunit AcrA (membrane-fusion protein)|tara:strand:- start:3683 stop:4408 length:726 start_codon:yes stop_codon:yes gene_type:complete